MFSTALLWPFDCYQSVDRSFSPWQKLLNVSGDTKAMKHIMKRYFPLGFGFSALTGMRRLDAPDPTRVQSRIQTPSQNGSRLPLAPDPPAVAAPAISEVPPVSNFTGTVVRDGSRFALREFDGTLFALDSTGRAWPFEGEDVSITGYFNPDSRLLHISVIRALDDLRAEAV